MSKPWGGTEGRVHVALDVESATIQQGIRGLL